MNTRTIATMFALALATTACKGDTAACENFAKHLAEVLVKEKSSQGGAVSDDLKAKMIKKTTDSCMAAPPTADQLACAMKAETSEAITACGEAKK